MVKKTILGTILIAGGLVTLTTCAVLGVGLWITYVVERKLPGGAR